MGRKAKEKREKKDQLAKEKRDTFSFLEAQKNPWSRIWARLDFWVYIICFIAVIAFPFVRPEAFSKNRYAILHTSMGDIKIVLYGDDAPKTVENFKKLADKGYYDDLLWHRVIKDFVIQTGDPNGDGTGGESADGGTFADEINADSLGLDEEIVGSTSAVYSQLSTDDQTKYLNSTVKAYYEAQGYTYIDTVQSHKFEAGSVAMANYGPNTNGSQFFIVTDAAQPHLDGQHTVFGKVVAGLDIVQAISKVSVDENDKPVEPVYLKSVEILDNSN